MNYSLITLEVLAVLMGLIVLLADLWVSPTARKALGLGLAAALGCLLAFAVGSLAPQSGSAFADMFVVDDLARYFKGFFLFAACGLRAQIWRRAFGVLCPHRLCLGRDALCRIGQ